MENSKKIEDILDIQDELRDGAIAAKLERIAEINEEIELYEEDYNQDLIEEKRELEYEINKLKNASDLDMIDSDFIEDEDVEFLGFNVFDIDNVNDENEDEIED